MNKEFSKEEILNIIETTHAIRHSDRKQAVDRIVNGLFGQEIPEGFKAHEGDKSPVPYGVRVDVFIAGNQNKVFYDVPESSIGWDEAEYYKVTSVPTLTLEDIKEGKSFYYIDTKGRPWIANKSTLSTWSNFIMNNDGAYATKALADLAIEWPDCLCETYQKMMESK
jgi:hypothetical protein